MTFVALVKRVDKRNAFRPDRAPVESGPLWASTAQWHGAGGPADEVGDAGRTERGASYDVSAD